MPSQRMHGLQDKQYTTQTLVEKHMFHWDILDNPKIQDHSILCHIFVEQTTH